VPTLIINDKWLVSGAIHYEELKNAIKKAQEA
jgi:predicted DsbA family dithiol-disulfide isomerase